MNIALFVSVTPPLFGLLMKAVCDRCITRAENAHALSIENCDGTLTTMLVKGREQTPAVAYRKDETATTMAQLIQAERAMLMRPVPLPPTCAYCGGGEWHHHHCVNCGAPQEMRTI